MRKKLCVLLVAVMMMTLLSGCAINNGQQNQSNNSAGNVNVEDVSLEGVYWLCLEGGVKGFYLDGNEKYVELSDEVYKEGTYDSMSAVIQNNVKTYNFRTFDEDGVCKFMSCEVRGDGNVHIGEMTYVPVDEVAFNERVPAPSPEPEPAPETNWSQPFMGKYFVGDLSYAEAANIGVYMDETYLYVKADTFGVSEPVELVFEECTEGVYFISEYYEDGYYYYVETGELKSINGYDGATLATLYVSDKATYDAIGTN